MCRTLACLLVASLLGSCGTFRQIGEPPGDYGRPALVRGVATTGSYLGASVGLVASVVLWPVTKGISFISDEPLGYSETEWVSMPLTASTAAGHYLLGLPVEGLYFLFYGAWVDDPPPVGFDHVPGGDRDPDRRH